ncbi:hypothetical protein PVAP13_4NG042800 [Panicum virgatum]|uniref:Uncharacterized protein n=1 Tax=Panicum virgatum TaxID=38727 RepID=A0A8T0T4N2_PANVG|nr:hypothetical protein PVAP13_4NG042800 [Panicum virgatum]
MDVVCCWRCDLMLLPQHDTKIRNKFLGCSSQSTSCSIIVILHIPTVVLGHHPGIQQGSSCYQPACYRTFFFGASK